MSYSYRLNIEAVFFRMAEDHFEKAVSVAGRVPDSKLEDGTDSSFDGFPTDEGIAAAVLAVVGWAVALESCTNFVWHEIMNPKMPTPTLQKYVMRNLSTIDKLEEILKLHSVELKTLGWWASANKLYSLRNEIVHYKEPVRYQGFGFAPKISRELSARTLMQLRSAAINGIRCIGSIAHWNVDFIDGDYHIVDASR